MGYEYKLSILICTVEGREHFLERLTKILEKQIMPRYWSSIEVISIGGNKEDDAMSIGAKRSLLLDLADGEYVCFIDDDDRVSENYVELLLPGIEKGVDCCSLRGIITEDGQNPLIFEHSIKYKEYKTNPEGMPVRYERYPNHLNCIKASIAKQFRFPETNHGEDTDWATKIFKSGLIKTEHYIDNILYNYEYRRKK